MSALLWIILSGVTALLAFLAGASKKFDTTEFDNKIRSQVNLLKSYETDIKSKDEKIEGLNSQYSNLTSNYNNA